MVYYQMGSTDGETDKRTPDQCFSQRNNSSI